MYHPCNDNLLKPLRKTAFTVGKMSGRAQLYRYGTKPALRAVERRLKGHMPRIELSTKGEMVNKKSKLL